VQRARSDATGSVAAPHGDGHAVADATTGSHGVGAREFGGGFTPNGGFTEPKQAKSTPLPRSTTNSDAQARVEAPSSTLLAARGAKPGGTDPTGAPEYHGRDHSGGALGSRGRAAPSGVLLAGHEAAVSNSLLSGDHGRAPLSSVSGGHGPTPGAVRAGQDRAANDGHHGDALTHVIDWAELAALRLIQVFDDAGIPTSVKKLKAPDALFEYLGVLFNMSPEVRRLHVGTEKVERQLRVMHSWSTKRVVPKKELRRALGWLSWAALCSPVMRIFMKRLWAALFQNPRSPWAKLGRGQQADAAWLRRVWPRLATRGVSVQRESNWAAAPRDNFFADACTGSTAKGVPASGGAVLNNLWCAFVFPPDLVRPGGKNARHPDGEQGEDIAILEFATLVIVSEASQFAEQLAAAGMIWMRSDNSRTVRAIENRTSTEPELMDGLRRLWANAASLDFDVRCEHVAGVNNPVADAASRMKFAEFDRAYRAAGRVERFGEPKRVDVPEALVRSVIAGMHKAAKAAARWRARFDCPTWPSEAKDKEDTEDKEFEDDERMFRAIRRFEREVSESHEGDRLAQQQQRGDRHHGARLAQQQRGDRHHGASSRSDNSHEDDQLAQDAEQDHVASSRFGVLQ